MLKAQDFKKREKERSNRVYDMLLNSFGNSVQNFLKDDDVIEIMLNPDGRLWIDRLSCGRVFTGENIAVQDAERIIKIISSEMDTVCNADNPTLSAELPGSGSRFQGFLPPVVKNATFTIRKKAIMVFNLEDYVKQGVITSKGFRIIKNAVKSKKNILIAGGTGSGKTTFANAILDEIGKSKDRIVLIEDTLELQCNAEDKVSLKTNDNVSMKDLLKSTMRLRPDRIIVGEVRGGEALTLLKAWNTGHPGGLSTVHANGAKESLIRIEQLIQEAISGIPRSLIADAINLIVYIKREDRGRKIEEIIEVEGCDSIKNEYLLKVLYP